jgi:hypothetical protein
MKKLMLWIIAFSLSGRVLPAQSLVGVWQGTLQTDTELSIVNKISTTDAGPLRPLCTASTREGARPVFQAVLQAKGLLSIVRHGRQKYSEFCNLRFRASLGI